MPDKLTKHTLFLRKGDFEYLRDRFPKKGASNIIRRAVARLVDELNPPITDEDLEEMELTNVKRD